MRIFGIVILYNPSFNVIENIKSYSNLVNKLIIYDNSNYSNYDIVKNLKCNFIYICNYKNEGISHPLNWAILNAKENNADWLLTMDQDSLLINKSIKNVYSWINCNNINDIAIISPCHKFLKIKNIYNNSNFTYLSNTITSGSILNLKLLNNNLMFDENLFIDGVDYDFCNRVNELNYKIISLKNYLIKHCLGDYTKSLKFLKYKIDISNHNPIRKYYMFRNNFYLIKKNFKSNFFICSKSNIIILFVIIFFEKNKLIKLKYCFIGFKDFILNNMKDKNE